MYTENKGFNEMEINKDIKLAKVKTGDSSVFDWSYKNWLFSYVDGDSRFDVRYPDGHWHTKTVYGNKTRAGAMEAIKQFLTLEELK